MDVISLNKANKTLNKIKQLDESVVAPLAEDRFPTVDARLDWLEGQASKIKAENSKQLDLSQGTFTHTELVNGKIRLKQINNTQFNYDFSLYNKVIYVDATNGNDSNDGSQEFPVKTASAAISLATSGSAVYFKEGNYEVSGFNEFFSKSNVHYFGDGLKSVINIKTKHILNTNITNNKFFKLTFQPDVSFTADKNLIYFGHSIVRTIDLEFYNCLFVDPHNRLSKGMRHCCYIAADASSGFEHNYQTFNFYNCVAIDTPLVTTWNDSSTDKIFLYNCATNVPDILKPNTETGHHNNIAAITCLANVSFNNSYQITSTGWQNTGTGQNRDGTRSHIGLYGHTYTWGLLFAYVSSGIWESPIIDLGEGWKETKLVDIVNQIHTEATNVSFEIATSTDGISFTSYTTLDPNNPPQARYIKIRATLSAQAQPGEVKTLDFNQSSPENTMTLNEYTEANGKLQLKNTYTYSMTDDGTLGVGKQFSFTINKANFKSIKSIGVN